MGEVSHLRLEIERVAWEYGKIGLLIDDSPQGGTRVARALYGSEVLPPWWRIACSLRCGCEALRAFRDICTDRKFTFLRALAVIDRYLPAECGEGKAIPWHKPDYKLDELDRIHVEEMQRIVSDLLKRSADFEAQYGPEPAYTLRFVTSFPALSEGLGSGGGGGEKEGDFSIPWQTRSIELLQEERRCMTQRNSDWKSLLRFGPEKTARITRDDDYPSRLWKSTLAWKAAKWKAQTWHQNLKRIVALLQGDGPVILVTGAGASLAPSRWSSGMPATEEMLEEVCAKLRGAQRETSRSLPERQDPCDCQAPVSRPEGRGPWNDVGTPIDWLVKESSSEHGLKGLHWKLEEIFARTLHRPEGLYAFDEFHRAFRETLYRSDYSYSYQHWLLARLPWTSLVTTNFDGFHERAATAVATLPSLDQKRRRATLRLGALHRIRVPASGPSDEEGALFKPYGSLYSLDGVIALGFEEIKDFEAHILGALKAALDQAGQIDPKEGRGALVVIGHAMRDNSIDQALKGLESRLENFDLLWVDPESYVRSWLERAGHRSVWSQWIYKRMAPESYSGAVPATALEFIYDLWWEYSKPAGL